MTAVAAVATIAGIGTALTMLAIPAVTLRTYRDRITAHRGGDHDTNILGERPDGYTARHRRHDTARWQPAHTRKTARGRHALADDGSGGWRVDLLVDKTREIDADQIDRALHNAGSGAR